MTSINQTNKKENKYPLPLKELSNNTLINLNKRKTYNYDSDITNNLIDSKIKRCLSEENNIPITQQVPSIASLSEEDNNYNTNSKNFYNTNLSNGMKIIKNDDKMLKEDLYTDLLKNNLNNNLNLNKPKINYLEYKFNQLNSELVTIKSDNLML